MTQRETKPLALGQITLKDSFFLRETGLVREKMVPWQWEALNDRIEDAAPSYCIHNFRAAARLQKARKEGRDFRFVPWNGQFEVKPGKGEKPDENGFYGFLFQDSDLYKWLEAVAYLQARQPDPVLQSHAEEVITLIEEAQDPDGYLDTAYQLHERKGIFENLAFNHELYCLGHLTEAAVAWHQATGDERLIRVVMKMIDFVREHFGPGKRSGYPGHEILEMALVRLYDETGDRSCLDLALYFLHERGKTPNVFLAEENRRRKADGLEELPEEESRKFIYQQAHIPVVSQREPVGHAVRAVYLYSGMADAVRKTGDTQMAEALEKIWQGIVREKMYVTGGIGATREGEAFSRPFDLPNALAYSETCAAIGLVFLCRRLLQLRCRGDAGHVMERALYNGVLSGVALDGRSFFYVNPLCVPRGGEDDERLSHVKRVRQKWFGCACCPPNLARLIASLPQYAVTGNGEELHFHLYMAQEISADLGGNAIRLSMEADLMRSGHVTVRVTQGSTRGRLAFRLPDWCDSPTLQGADFTVLDGYAWAEKEWKAGDVLTLDFPMRVRYLRSDPRVDADAGRVCVAYGPFVMCAEEKDNGQDLGLLCILPGREARVSMEEIGGVGMPCVRVSGKRLRIPDRLYGEWTEELGEEKEIVLRPYFAWNNRGPGEMRVWLRAGDEGGLA